MALFEWDQGENISPLDESTLLELGLKERSHIQRMLRDNIGVIDEELMVISEEYGAFEESRRALDLLCLDKNANIVVVELKRNEDGGHMELQAIRYAAMVSALTLEHVIEAHKEYLIKRGLPNIEPRDAIHDFLGWQDLEEHEFGKNVRIVLISGNFSKELTTSVLWLNKYLVDIQCYRLKPYAYEKQILLDVEKIIPLPEAESYQIQLKNKANEERKRNSGIGEKQIKYWTNHLKKASEKTSLHTRNQPQASNYISAHTDRLAFSYTHTRDGIRAEFYIDVEDRERNKRIFDTLLANRKEIEKDFGKELVWERLDNKRAARVSTQVLDANGRRLLGYADPEETWEETQEIWIDAMIRLERAIRPNLVALKQ